MASSWATLGFLKERRGPRLMVARRVSCRRASADTDRVKLPVGEGGARLVTDTGDTGPVNIIVLFIKGNLVK